MLTSYASKYFLHSQTHKNLTSEHAQIYCLLPVDKKSSSLVRPKQEKPLGKVNHHHNVEKNFWVGRFWLGSVFNDDEQCNIDHLAVLGDSLLWSHVKWSDIRQLVFSGINVRVWHFCNSSWLSIRHRHLKMTGVALPNLLPFWFF